MHCDEARDNLLDRLDIPAAERPELTAHLEGCEECRALSEDIRAMQSQARVWHDVNPPPWNADSRAWREPGGSRAASPSWLGLIQQWFPVLASTAALLLALGIYLDEPAANDAPSPEVAIAPRAGDPAAGEAAAEALLAAGRRERRQEIEALTALLKAEMDRRSLETEESLKYIISHQIQSQRELEAMRGRLMPAERTTEQL